MREMYTTSYSAKKYTPGVLITTKNCGDLVILGKSLKNTTKYYVKFVDTKTVLEVHASSLSSGSIKDPRYPTVYGIGYIGEGSYQPKHNAKEYDLWKGILRRVHESTESRQKHVCEEWKCFQTFCIDLPKIENYDSWVSGKPYQLDKDSKSDSLLYSIDTCIFLSKEDNELLGATYNCKEFLATRLDDGTTIKASVQAEFAREYGLTASKISKCLNGHARSHKGWRFEWL